MKKSKKKNNIFLTVFPDFEEQHIYKDVGQVNYFSAQELDMEAHLLVYDYQNCSLSEFGFHFVRIKKIFKRVPHVFLDLNIVCFLILNSKNIQYLNLYHPTYASQIYTILYKTLNCHGKAYIKLDLDLEDAKKDKGILDKGLKGWVKRFVFEKYKSMLDVASVESKDAYKLLLKRNIYTSNQLILIPNGVSSKKLPTNVDYSKKENIIITVARLGVEQKNNQLMLSALTKCNLKNWQYFFIGPIENGFENDIKAFQRNNPQLTESVKFLGPKTRKEIIEYYERSKVFGLSSNYEGFPLVYVEASFFGCYIITTAVSGSKDITDNQRLGDITPINDIDSFANAIQNIIDKDVSIKQFDEIRKHAITNFTWESIIPKLVKKLSNG